MDEENESTAAPPAASAPSTTIIPSVPFNNNAPLESDGTAILVPATLEPHPINVARMSVPTHDM